MLRLVRNCRYHSTLTKRLDVTGERIRICKITKGHMQLFTDKVERILTCGRWSMASHLEKQVLGVSPISKECYAHAWMGHSINKTALHGLSITSLRVRKGSFGLISIISMPCAYTVHSSSHSTQQFWGIKGNTTVVSLQSPLLLVGLCKQGRDTQDYICQGKMFAPFGEILRPPWWFSEPSCVQRSLQERMKCLVPSSWQEWDWVGESGVGFIFRFNS